MRWWKPLIAAAAIGPLAFVLLAPSHDPDSYVYSATGYTKLIEDVFIAGNFLEYTSNFDSDDLPIVRLAPGAANVDSVRRFAANSYLGDDLRRNDVWELRGGHLHINPNAHNISLPLTTKPSWTGNLLFHHGGELRATLSGPVETTLIPLTHKLAANDPEIVTRDPFVSGPPLSNAARLDFNYGGAAGGVAHVFMLGEDMWVRSVENPQANLFVDGKFVPPGTYRRLPPGAELQFQTGNLSKFYFSRGVTGANVFVSHYQPLAGRIRVPMLEWFALRFETEMDHLVTQNAEQDNLSLTARARNRQVLDGDIISSLDADLQTALQHKLEDFVAPGLKHENGRGFPAAITVMDARTGQVLALASYPAIASQGAGTRRAWEQNQNFVNLPIGSAAKPLLTSAILEIWPELATLQIPAPSSGTHGDLLGFHIAPVLNEEASFGGGWITFNDYLQRSSNIYAATLMMLATASDPLTPDPDRPSSPWRLLGKARDHLPALQIEAGNVMDTISCCVKWGDELARLYDVRVEDIERQGETTIFADDRYDKSLWRPMLATLPDDRFLRQDNFNSVSPARVNLQMNNVRNFRTEYLTLILGASTSRWNNVKLAEAYARLVTGRRVEARLTEAGPDPLPMTGCNTTRDADGLFCNTEREPLLHALALVALPPGTAGGQVGPKLAPLIAEATRRGEVIGFYSKTGTPKIPDANNTPEAMAVRQLGRDGVIRLDPKGHMIVALGDKVLDVHTAADIAPALAAIENDSPAFQSIGRNRALVRKVLNRVLAFNRARYPSQGAQLFRIINRKVVGIPMSEGKQHEGRVYAFVIGVWPKSAERNAATHEVDVNAPPIRALSVAINIQDNWVGEHPHLGAQLGGELLALLAPTLFPADVK
ncbi:MAG: hypothetical protein ISS15_14865 [Alphaproteobacteria bacterium]|nr:hypothetical protein [Alphaproteobacteria bacterium]MBL7098937.1 hypothetical protein [Alphaproteobacteria bacterium]